MVHAEGRRGKEGVEIKPFRTVKFVDHVGSLGFLHVDDNVETVPKQQF